MNDITSYFSANYAGARGKFLAAAKEARAETESQVLSLRGPNGEELAMDFAVLGSQSARAGLVLLCATHGIEGFCGSGCEIGLLHEGVIGDLARSLHVVVVHAHNPHGFAWLRRVNEDNVDLNRNYVDHSLPHPENPDYELLKNAIAPREIEGPVYEAAIARLRAYAEEHGAFGLQAAMTRGQYRYTDGLYYGGREATWSHRTLTAMLQRHLRQQQQVAVVDFHTGLGPFGHGEIINEFEPGAPGDLLIEKWFGGEARSTRRGESVSADLTGTIDGGIPRILPWAETIAFALEYGTVSSNEVLAATRADNWLHLYGDLASPQGKAIKAEIRRVFYPDTDHWKRLVFSRALDVVARTAEGLLREVQHA